jgi:hypothetical protein
MRGLPFIVLSIVMILYGIARIETIQKSVLEQRK